MLEVGEKLLYKAFGLNLSSDIQFPELIRLNDLTLTPNIDVEIRHNDALTAIYRECSGGKQGFIIQDDCVMFQIDDVATFSVQNGSLIQFAPVETAEEDEVRLLLLGTCMGSILMQRKIFPLHGSAIAVNGKAYAIVGESGAGKSTLASTFLKLGYQLLSDDVIAVTMSADGTGPMVTPSYPQQKLWEDSLHHFGLEAADYRSIYGRWNKFCVPVQGSYLAEPMPLAGVIELMKYEGNEGIRMSQVQGLERIHTLLRHTYRNFIIGGLGLTEWHFKLSAVLANHIQMFQLQRACGRIYSTSISSNNSRFIPCGGITMAENQTITQHDYYVQAPGYIVSDMGGEKVMLSVNNGKYYNLGAIGGRIWELMENPTSVSQIVDTLLCEYEVESQACEEQVISFIEVLSKEGLIQAGV